MAPANDYTPTVVPLGTSRICAAFALPLDSISNYLGSKIMYYAIEPNGTLNATSTANAPGHWFGNTGTTVAWGASAYVFSELKMSTLSANIGQYPSRCKNGDTYTFKQALVYKKSTTETAQVTLIFTLHIGSTVTDLWEAPLVSTWNIYPNPTTGLVSWDSPQSWTLQDALGHELQKGTGSSVDLTSLSKGIYILQVGSHRTKILRE